jgi:putative colanic acid biosynthesis acetyltransferase WcaF
MAEQRVDLSRTTGYDFGRSFFIRALWMWTEALLFHNPFVVSFALKRWVLRRFGAEIGPDVVIKPGLHIKHPWKLRVGANTWLGERVWIDNPAQVTIGANVCVSQGAYICSGNHDWSDPGLGVVNAPIEIGDGVWVGAFTRVAAGLTVGEQAVLGLGCVLFTDAEAKGIYRGNPAERVGTRSLRDTFGPRYRGAAADGAGELVAG